MASGLDPQLFTNSPELHFESPPTAPNSLLSPGSAVNSVPSPNSAIHTIPSPNSAINSLPSPNSAPLAYYDLLAEDAVNNIDKYNLNLDLDKTSFSRRQSPERDTVNVDPSKEPWNSSEVLPLTDDDLVLFQHYVDVIGPILDLNDPSKQFTLTIPGMAVHNVGLLKSLLAVSARHMALMNDPQPHPFDPNECTPSLDASSSENCHATSPLIRMATQCYYETLHYLSKNLLYPSYSKSREIVATSVLISTYEMWDSGSQYGDGAWERHLRGCFWIYRSQNSNGECKDPLRRAAWWQWMRQDIWVAFREGRRVLTIWRPTKRLMDLSADELALRIVYICARCVDFAANKKYNIDTRIDQGRKLLQALDDWYRALPPPFHPIHREPLPEPGAVFSPIWIHPPSYAAAIQTFHFARIIVLINQPSIGGIDEFRVRQRLVDESVETICGIATMQQGRDLPSAMVNFQAVYAGKLRVITRPT